MELLNSGVFNLQLIIDFGQVAAERRLVYYESYTSIFEKTVEMQQQKGIL